MHRLTHLNKWMPRDSSRSCQSRTRVQVQNCVKLITCIFPLCFQRDLHGQRDDSHAWDWFRGLSLIILCHRLNWLLKSNYQAVCVAYKIGAATRGGEDWKGWEIASCGETLSGCQIWGISREEILYTRFLETLVYFEWALSSLWLSCHQIKAQA